MRFIISECKLERTSIPEKKPNSCYGTGAEVCLVQHVVSYCGQHTLLKKDIKFCSSMNSSNFFPNLH